MKDWKGDRNIKGCNCLNCRLERMESAVIKMNDSVNVIIEARSQIPSMPKDANNMHRKKGG